MIRLFFRQNNTSRVYIKQQKVILNDSNIKTSTWSTGICPQRDIFFDNKRALTVLCLSHERDRVIRTCASSTVRKSSYSSVLRGGGEKYHPPIAITLVGNQLLPFWMNLPMQWTKIAFDGRGWSSLPKGWHYDPRNVKMYCIRSQLRLKKKYGWGFKLSFLGRAANMRRAMMGIVLYVGFWHDVWW
jgi:hypothetical protein